MKLLIDIPDWYYEETKEFKHPDLIDKAIINGTPFDSVIEDIKAEIEEVRKNALGFPNWEYAKGLETAWNIIDKHISGKENNESPNL